MTDARCKIQTIFFDLGDQPAVLRYGLAVLVVVATTFATIYFPVIGDRAAFLLFAFGINLVSFWLGKNPGFLAAALSLIAVNALILFPAETEFDDLLILNAAFCFVSVVMVATTSFHRRITHALWESRQDLDRAQTVGQIGSWRLDIKRDELIWSDENHRIFGIPIGTPKTYQTFLAIVHPEDRDYVDRMWRAGLRGEPYDIEHRLLVDGAVKWVREKAWLEYDKKGNLLGGFGTTQDITDHKRNELELRDSRQRYADIVESASDAIITIDVDQRILLFNSAAEKMFGCSTDEAIGGTIERFMPERFRAAHGSSIRGFDDAGVAHRIKNGLSSIRGIRADGEEFPIEASISKCEINGEKTFTVIMRDVTDRTNAELAMKEQIRLQDQLTKVAATVPGVICSFRLRPDGTACMPYASPLFESVYGFSPELVVEDFSPVFARTHPDDLVHIHATIAESARTLQAWRDAFRYNHPTKGEIWIEGHSMPRSETDGGILWHGYIQDITDRKLAELTLRDRENELRLIMDATPALISYLDTEFKYLRVNATYEKWFGITADRILGRKAPEIIGQEAWRTVKPYFERALAGEQVNFDQQIPYGHGEPRWVQATYIPNTDTTGKIKGVVVHVVDVTDRKLTEKKIDLLNRSLERRVEEMQVIFNTAPIGLCIADGSDVYDIRGNPALEVMLGIPMRVGLSNRSEVMNAIRVMQNGLELANEDLPMRRAVRGEVVKNQVIDIIRPDSQQITILGNASPLFNEQGEPRGAVGAFLDITALKQAEQELRNSEARLALVVEEVNAGYWDWDLITRQLFLSPELKRQIGLDDSESLNRSEDWESRLHSDDRAYVMATIENFIADHKPNFELEFRLRHKDGSYRWIHSRGVLLSDQNNRAYRILGINLDITDYMKQKKLNERRDKMEQSSRLYVAVQTAAAFAHELNQPLSAISSYADVALHLCQTDNPNPQKLCQVMEKCSQQAQRAGEVIRQLVSLLQKGETVSEPVDINAAIHEVFDLMKTDGLSDEFKIELDLAVDLPPVKANALQIQKVLINLLRNGLESMLEQREKAEAIIVTTQRDEADPTMIRVTVRDSGIGVENPAALRNIFQPFHSTKPAGLGMGLAISRSLIAAHGGKMWAEPNAGNGLSIHFTLPCAI
ncbi:PAS domain S-box protein [Methylotuvimicrobium buryatense]|uniref:histidine kinase n=1 Tax=Methylotuvimicrobium buryatense TaxID=95641 RepID=A0A4P9UWG2_METBY|nr:PAS domain S-box protein [Methylotuvimicrobium buryatense]QCW84096.1 PAS domain S-box protein [Methylotuvimicrobium buryatense]